MDSLIEEADLALLDAAVRLRPRSALAHARRAALRLTDQEITPGVSALCKSDLARARLLAPDDAEIAWYHWVAIKKMGETQAEKEALERATALGELPDERILSLVQIQAALGADSEVIEMLTRALARGSEKHALTWRVKRFQLAASNGDFAVVEEDWAALVEKLELPQPHNPAMLLDTYLQAVHHEASRLREMGEVESAVDLLRPAALIREIMLGSNDTDTGGSWMAELAEWEFPAIQLVPRESEWHYHDKGEDLGEAWREPGYDDRSWDSGRGILGAGSFAGKKPATLIEIGPENEHHITTYFRRQFHLPEDFSAPLFDFELFIDDGAVVYLNGEEILRTNMRENDLVIDATTTAKETRDAGLEGVYDQDKNHSLNLRSGQNVLAVEVHQVDKASSDLGFDLSLSAQHHSLGSYLLDALGEDDSTLLMQVEQALPASLRTSWMREFRFVTRGEIDGDATNICDALWTRRFAFLREIPDWPSALDAVERRLASLDGGSPHAHAATRIEWLFRWMTVLKALGRPTDEIETARSAIIAGPPRDPNLSSKLIDLSEHHNASLYDGRVWVAKRGSNLAQLPATFSPRHGVNFDLRGIIQLKEGAYIHDTASNRLSPYNYPREITGIEVDQKTEAIHFLLSSNWGEESGEDIVAARFTVHFSDGDRAEVPLVFGESITTLWDGISDFPEERIGWRGTNPAARARGREICLGELIWKNPHPDKTISQIDFATGEARGAPFLVGITLE